MHDSVGNVQDFLAQEVIDQFAVAEASAIISGNGTSKPTGFLNAAPEAVEDDDSPPRTWPALRYISTGDADGFTNSRLDSPPGDPADALIDCMGSLRPVYRQGAVWVMSSNTLSVVRKIKDADGNYIWRAGLTQADGESLLGYPVRLCE